MAVKKTIEEVRKTIELKGALLLSDTYVNSTTPLEIKCTCGNVFKRQLKIINRSPICKCSDCTKVYVSKQNMMPYEEVIKKVKDLQYELLVSKEDYFGINKKYNLICKNGHKIKMYLNDLLSGHECKKCATEKVAKAQMLTYQEVRNYIESFNYKLLSTEYKGSEEKLNVICNNGHKCSISYNNFKHGHRCSFCAVDKRTKSQTIPYEDRKRHIESFGYKLLTKEKDYINGSQKVKMKCSKGHTFKMSCHCFFYGQRCPYCNESKGERRVKSVLDKSSVMYVSQYRFEDCKARRVLPFDFYLPTYNCCIEYDGKQHYLYGGFNGDLLELMNIQYRDTIKNKYCKDNDIKLIRIPYWRFDEIEEILKHELEIK